MFNELDIIEIISDCEKLTNSTIYFPIRINSRLKKALGRTKYSTVETNGVTEYYMSSIDFSEKFLEVATYEELVHVVKHEYAHFLTVENYGVHTHYTPEYIKWCNILGVSNNPKLKLKNKLNIQMKYSFYCKCCGNNVLNCKTANHRVVRDTTRFTSKCCKSGLRMVKNY